VCFEHGFVVLSRTEAEAQAVVATVQQALTALELQLDPDQVTVSSFAQGFRFVEYVFINHAVSDTASPSEPAPPLPLAIVSTAEAAPVTDTPSPALSDNAAITVFVTGQISCTVRTEQGRLQVTRTLANGLVETVVDQPWSRVQTLVLMGGQHHITTPAVRAALANAVVVHFVSGRGEYQGSTQAAADGMATAGAWLAQVTRFAERAHQLSAARLLVQTRLRHQREVLRKRNPKRQFDEALAQLQTLLKQVPLAEELATLRGLEGKAAQVYFAALRTLLPTWVGFESRQRRPPPDPFNALLSLGYTVLFSYVEVALRVNGLLPWVGLYHQPHGQHAVLASDMMEPFRHLVERAALNAVQRGTLAATDFELDATRGCRLLDAPRRQYLALLVQQFESPLRSSQSSEPRVLLQQLDWQAKQLRAWVRGEVAELVVWQVA
jgi:CRISPR-associated endonuclease Cas1